MDTNGRYPMLVGGDWADTYDRFEIRSPAAEELAASAAKGGREHAEEKFVHVDLSGRPDRRAHPLPLSTPPA